MSVFGIVCEFNPLHNGHEYLIKEARKLGAEKIVCIMSGNSTQRGDFAITDKYSRAEAAVRCGADAVFELPFPWCSASADYFAVAGVAIADEFCDKLLFGSECGDVELLSRAAELCENASFKEDYLSKTASGEGAASSFAKILEENGICGLSSNDLLGIAYIRAIKRLNSKLEAMTVNRLGADYNCSEITKKKYQSATALRAKILNGESVEAHIPSPMNAILERERNNGHLTDMTEFDSAVLAFFRLADASSFDGVCDAAGGIANRIIDAARSSTSYGEMFDRIRTKRYTDAKLRRAILFCMTDTKEEAVCSFPEYTTLLALNAKGRELIASNRKKRNLAVVTKPADAPAGVQKTQSLKLDAIYTLARKNKISCDAFVKKSVYVEK